MAMIALEPMPDESLGSDDRDVVSISELIADLSVNDARRLRQLISNHARYTGSPRAKHILDHWVEMLPKFRKVMPVEFRRVLAELAEQSKSAADSAVPAEE